MIIASTDYAVKEFKKLSITDPVNYLYMLYNPDEKLIIKWILEKAKEYQDEHNCNKDIRK